MFNLGTVGELIDAADAKKGETTSIKGLKVHSLVQGH